jgi:hypothetical protein
MNKFILNCKERFILYKRNFVYIKMASGSYFTLLRKTKNNLKFSDKFIEEFIIHNIKKLRYLILH